ncbi:hypothetical protein NtRootC45_35650 [Arthrobacter sp. NtRootC45]|nr:hypothetical protein NtRootC45_35650 [Arthrobacter sp. NtRootC45]
MIGVYGRHTFFAGTPGAFAPPHIHKPSVCDGRQPGLRITWHVMGPLKCGLQQGFLDGVFACIELAVLACQHAEDLRREGAQQVLDVPVPVRVQLDLRWSVRDGTKLHDLRVFHNA